MECKAISTTKHRPNGAFTLIEVMVASVVASIVFAAVASMTIYSARSFSSLFNYTDLDQYSRKCLDIMVRDVRSSDGLSSYGTNGSGVIISLVFNSDGGNNNLSYTYNPTNRTLVRSFQLPGAPAAEVTTNLVQCDGLAFSIFGHESIVATFDQFPVTNAPNVRLIKVDWTCSRTILGMKYNTESVQSAKIVLRRS